MKVEEHHVVHVFIREFKKLKPSDERFEAKFNVLGELVKHHIQEEEGEILPQAQDSDLDWEALDAKVMTRREQLMSSGSIFSRKAKGRPAGEKARVSPRGRFVQSYVTT